MRIAIGLKAEILRRFSSVAETCVSGPMDWARCSVSSATRCRLTRGRLAHPSERSLVPRVGHWLDRAELPVVAVEFDRPVASRVL